MKQLLTARTNYQNHMVNSQLLANAQNDLIMRPTDKPADKSTEKPADKPKPKLP